MSKRDYARKKTGLLMEAGKLTQILILILSPKGNYYSGLQLIE